MKKNIVIVSFIFVLIGAMAQTAAPKKKTGTVTKTSAASSSSAPAHSTSGLPSHADVDAALQRNFGYDPAITWNILDIRSSPITGVADVLVSMNKQNPVHSYVS